MAKQEAKKERRPKAQKRDEQNEKRRLNNRMYKSRVRTAIRSFQDALSKKDENVIKDQLNEVYSLLDKCVKKGVFKLNKVSRTKSRLTARAVAKA
jgi:small subunit ribosomal protein S20